MGNEVLVKQLTDAIECALGNAERWPEVYALLEAAGAPARQTPSGIVASLGADYGLTGAERAVLVRIIEGLSPREIAERDDVSIATVRTHIAHLHEKFGVGRTIDLLRAVLTEALRGD